MKRGERLIQDMAQSLVNEAQNASLTPLEPEGIRLDQAVANGTITITSEDFRFVEAPLALSGRSALSWERDAGIERHIRPRM